MKIHSGVEKLTQIQPSQEISPARAQQGILDSGLHSDIASVAADQASLSSAGTQVAQSTSTAAASHIDNVRLDKVASIQAQLQAGTYSVSASDVAQKVIGALLVPNQ